MGIFSILDSRTALPPNTQPVPPLPPLSKLPKLSSDRSDPSWSSTSAPISPPMSHYDRSPLAEMPSGKTLEDRSRDAGAGQAGAPRQQLPSLSSLFGPASQMRPLNSPLSDRPSPYSAPSPLDRPHPSAPSSASTTQPERTLSGSSSYFPNTAPPPPPPPTQPRSTYDGRYGQEPAPYPRSLPAPISPRTREADQSRPDTASDVGSSSRWSVQPEMGRHEYSLGSRESSSYKSSTQDRNPPPHLTSQRSHEQQDMYREPQQHQRHAPPPPQLPSSHPSAATNPPSTPVGTPSLPADTIPTKDGLGPKIWTGTHFLPRFVRAAEVPGEGMCYFYDDGSHCKTIIDGEAVNAHWGVTKAGKPRKRLAIACVTCREKKIKCDPDFPRCVQCEKFGRICHFKNAPRGGHSGSSPGNSPGDPEEARRMMGGGPVMGGPKPNDHLPHQHQHPNAHHPHAHAHQHPQPHPHHHQPPPQPHPQAHPYHHAQHHPHQQRRPGSQSSPSISPRAGMMRPASPDSLPLAKRPRTGPYDSMIPPSSTTPHSVNHNNGYAVAPPPPLPPMHTAPLAGGDSSVMSRTPESTKSSLSWQQPELPRIHEDVLARAWQTDPYVNDPESVVTVIASFFTRTECTGLRFLPEKPFLAWVQQQQQQSASTHTRKSPEDQMLIYSMLALGLALGPLSPSSETPTSTTTPTASAPRARGIGESGGPSAPSINVSADRTIALDYAQVARYATSKAKLSIQLVQSRLILALFYLTISRPCDSNDMLTSAISAAVCLQLNMELPTTRVVCETPFPYGLNRKGYAEMRRRTFWSCFILERLNGLFPDRMATINPDDVFIRLPSPAFSFENLNDAPSPMFQEPPPSPRQQQGERDGKDTKMAGQTEDVYGKAKEVVDETEDTMGPMAYLVNISGTWGDVMTAIYRLAHRGPDYDFDYGTFYHHSSNRLARWHSSLSPRYGACSPQVLEEAVTRGEFGTVITMHLLYHLTGLKLNRHVPPKAFALHTQQQRQRQEQVEEQQRLQHQGEQRLLLQQHHVSQAREHARCILHILSSVRDTFSGFAAGAGAGAAEPDSAGPCLGPGPGRRTEIPLPPLCSYALVEAVDVVSAGCHHHNSNSGPSIQDVPSILSLFSAARETQVILSNVWDEAAVQTKVTYDRIASLRRAYECATEIITRQQQPSTPNTPPTTIMVDSGCRVFLLTTTTTRNDDTRVKLERDLDSHDSEPQQQEEDRENIVTSVGWQMLDPMEARFLREMDVVYSSSSSLSPTAPPLTSLPPPPLPSFRPRPQDPAVSTAAVHPSHSYNYSRGTSPTTSPALAYR